jgi:cell division septum initiation protein DivIVA
MKRQITFAIVLFSALGAFAQVTQEDLDNEIKPLSQKVNSLQSENSKLESEIGTLNTKLSNANNSIDSLRSKTQENSSAISQTANQLGIKITTTEQTANKRIDEVGQSLSKNSLYGIIGVLSAILLSGLLFWLLSKKQKTDKTEVEIQLSNAKKSIEEEQVLINTKLAEIYTGQMELLKQERKANPTIEIDHSLALKVADEIVKIQMNLAHMDSKIRGHRHLSIAVGNVFDNFKANGYEIIDLLNKPYNDGMNMQATKEPDPNLKEREQVIRRIIKPEIHFNNKIIQHAQVIVAYGE